MTHRPHWPPVDRDQNAEQDRGRRQPLDAQRSRPLAGDQKERGGHEHEDQNEDGLTRAAGEDLVQVDRDRHEQEAGKRGGRADQGEPELTPCGRIVCAHLVAPGQAAGAGATGSGAGGRGGGWPVRVHGTCRVRAK